MKFIGNQIYQWISRFRNDVYLEDLATSTEQSYLVVDSEGKITKRTTLNSGSNDITTTGDINSTNVIITGEIRGPATTIIDPAPVGDNNGVLQIKGDLQVDGTTTTINSTTLTVDDKNIVLSSGSTTSLASDGAGITIDGASATLTYAHSDTSWNFNKNLNINGPSSIAGTTLNINNNYGESNKSITFTHNDGVTEVAKICAYGRANNAIPPYFLIKVNNTVSGGSNSTSSSDRFKIQSDGTFMFNTVGGDEKVRITSDGSVGIGTASPYTKLNVVSTGSGVVNYPLQLSNLTTTNNSGVGMIFNVSSNSAYPNARIVVERTDNDASGEMSFWTTSGNSGTITERLRIDRNGKVGIGTDSPSRNLQVKNTSSTASIAITSSNTGLAQLELGGTSDNDIAGVSYNSNTQKLFLKTNNTGQLYIDNSGNVGIGLTGPTEKLEVNGNIKL